MKLDIDYTKEPYSFSVTDVTLSSDNPLRFRKNLLQKLSISEKIKVIDNKIVRFLLYHQEMLVNMNF